MIPQQTPVNPRKNQNWRLTKCTKFISRPQTQSSYKLVSYRMVGLEICLTCTCPTSPGKPRNLFSKKHAFYKIAWLTRKTSLQNASVCYKKSPWNGTWVKPFHSGNIHRDAFVKCPCAFRRRRLAQNAGPGIRVRPFPCNFPNKMALVKCPCASRLLIQTCCQETLGSFYRDRAKRPLMEIFRSDLQEVSYTNRAPIESTLLENLYKGFIKRSCTEPLL